MYVRIFIRIKFERSVNFFNIIFEISENNNMLQTEIANAVDTIL